MEQDIQRVVANRGVAQSLCSNQKALCSGGWLLRRSQIKLMRHGHAGSAAPACHVVIIQMTRRAGGR